MSLFYDLKLYESFFQFLSASFWVQNKQAPSSELHYLHLYLHSLDRAMANFHANFFVFVKVICSKIRTIDLIWYIAGSKTIESLNKLLQNHNQTIDIDVCIQTGN